MELPSPTAPGQEITSLSGALSPAQPPKIHTFTRELNECLGRKKTHTEPCAMLILPRILNPSQKTAYCLCLRGQGQREEAQNLVEQAREGMMVQGKTGKILKKLIFTLSADNDVIQTNMWD